MLLKPNVSLYFLFLSVSYLENLCLLPGHNDSLMYFLIKHYSFSLYGLIYDPTQISFCVYCEVGIAGFFTTWISSCSSTIYWNDIPLPIE